MGYYFLISSSCSFHSLFCSWTLNWKSLGEKVPWTAAGKLGACEQATCGPTSEQSCAIRTRFSAIEAPAAQRYVEIDISLGLVYHTFTSGTRQLCVPVNAYLHFDVWNQNPQINRPCNECVVDLWRQEGAQSRNLVVICLWRELLNSCQQSSMNIELLTIIIMIGNMSNGYNWRVY